ncbi:MAG: Mur ligase family protein, partial [Parcubacteria group bacterium]
MKKTLQKILALFAKAIIKKYRPKIIGITGSIGKTSAKEAVYAVLAAKFSARRNLKNYNNELGVPLTIIGQESGGKSPCRWLSVFSSAIKLIISKDKNYPDALILEMGADKPGDIEYLLGIAPVDIGVVTKIGPAHLEFFKTIENIAKEKLKIISNLKSGGFAILNYDDELVRKMSAKTKGRVISFGQNESADVRSIDMLNQGKDMDLKGIQFKINYKGATVPVFLPNVI